MKKSFKRLVLLVTVLMFTSGCGGSSDDCSGGLILTIFSGGLLAPTLNDCGSYSSGNDSFYDDCSNRILLDIYIYNNVDGLGIADSYGHISNQDAEKVYY